MQDASQPSQKSANDSLTLHLKNVEFAEFLSSLLGRPQKIERTCNFNYVIDREGIANTYAIVDQRVRQNGAKTIEFTASIAFSDNSLVEFKTIEDLECYREIRSATTVEVRLSWAFLIKFPDKNIPEKQSIDIAFFADHGTYYCRDIHYAIGHTNRSWGEDVDSLLKGHVSSYLVEPNKFRELSSKHSGHLGVMAGLLFIVLATFSAVTVATNIGEILSGKDSRSKFIRSTSIEQLSDQIQDLSALYASGVWPRFNFIQGVFFISSAIVAIIIGFWVEAAARLRESSHILFTKADGDRLNQMSSENKNKLFAFIGSLVVTVTSGLLSRVAFYYVSKIWLDV
jgi:hypothetical protein